jgi:hypothetical protein
VLVTDNPFSMSCCRRTPLTSGGDATAYRNHTYRVANLCVALTGGDRAQLEKIAIAAACHDLGIWSFIKFGLPRELMRDIYAAWPSAGFHKRSWISGWSGCARIRCRRCRCCGFEDVGACAARGAASAGACESQRELREVVQGQSPEQVCEARVHEAFARDRQVGGGECDGSDREAQIS